MAHIFIETSAQIRRLTTREGRKTFSALLDREISLKFYTSLYVLMELRRTICEDIFFIRDRLLEIKPDDNGLVRLEEIDYALANAPIFSTRRAKRLFLITGKIKEMYIKEAKVEARALIAFLETLAQEYMRMSVTLRRYSQKKSYQKVKLIDFVNCSRVDIDIIKNILGHRISCNKKDGDCEIHNLILSFKTELLNFVKAEISKDKDQRAIEIVEKFLSGNLDSLRGEKTCWKIGDIIITLEARKADCNQILTADKHFSALCPSFGLQMLPFQYDEGC